MCAKSYTVGPQQYIPAFLPAGSSGTNSCTERDSVLNSLKAISADARVSEGVENQKGKSIGTAHEGGWRRRRNRETAFQLFQFPQLTTLRFQLYQFFL